MSILDLIMRNKKPIIWSRFLSMGGRDLPQNVDPPKTPEDAMAMGYRMGLQAGYGEGLADGVDLGMDVGTCFAQSAATPVISFPEPVDVC
jgi:hypothetical protein